MHGINIDKTKLKNIINKFFPSITTDQERDKTFNLLELDVDTMYIEGDKKISSIQNSFTNSGKNFERGSKFPTSDIKYENKELNNNTEVCTNSTPSEDNMPSLFDD